MKKTLIVKKISNLWVKSFLLWGLMMVMITLGGGCSPKEDIVIGVLGTMTGANSDLSISGRRGIEIAVDEINNMGGVMGREIVLRLKDDENTVSRALDKIDECLVEGIPLIIGPYTSGMITPIIEDVNERDVLLMGPTISADSLSGRDDNFIRFIASTKEQATILVNEIGNIGLHKVMVLSDSRNAGFTDALVENFLNLMLELQQQEIVTLRVDPSNDSELSQALKDVEKYKPDGLFIIASAEDVAQIAQQLHKATFKTQLFAPLWANTPELLRKGGDAVEGIYVLGGIDPDSTSEAYLKFSNTFEQRYGELPTFSSLYSYELMMALAKVMESTRSTDPQTLKEKFVDIGNFEGLQGDLKIDSNGDNTRAYLLFRNENGELRKVN